jgi:hypothetical protein
MTPSLRKFALTAHVTCSVGWLGAVVGFLALAVTGLTSEDTQIVRSVYVAMELTGWYVIVPLSFASLLTGLVQSLGTSWGLIRHYWVLAKLLITVFATILLLIHMQPVSRVAGEAAWTLLSSADLRGLRIQLVVDAGAALLVLLVATALSVYKPLGMTPYGRRRQQVRDGVPQRSEPGSSSGRDLTPGGSTTRSPRWVYACAIIVIVLIHLFVIQHVMGGGLGGHAGHMPILR